MHLRRHVAKLALAALPFTSPLQVSRAPAVDVEIDRDRDLSAFATYAWSPEQSSAADLATHLRIVNAVQDHMKEMGFRIDTVRPEIRVRYRFEQGEGVEAQSSQRRSVWDPTDVKVEVAIERERRMKLSLEVTEEDSGALLWRAEGTYPMATPDRLPKQIRDAVADVFQKWPADEEPER